MINMKLKNSVTSKQPEIRIGDIVIFSETIGFMIIYNGYNKEYLALDILNNGNRTLGYPTYSDNNIENLMKRLFKD